MRHERKRSQQVVDMKLFFELDGKFQEVFPNGDPATVKSGRIKAMGTLENGMSEGNPSVGFMIELDDGTCVFAQTSLKLFQMANAAFTGKWGDVTEEGWGIHISEDRPS